MSYKPNKMGMLVQINPDQARKQLLTAFRRYDGGTTQVATALDVNIATVKRWIAKLEIRPQVEEMRQIAADAAAEVA